MCGLWVMCHAGESGVVGGGTVLSPLLHHSNLHNSMSYSHPPPLPLTPFPPTASLLRRGHQAKLQPPPTPSPSQPLPPQLHCCTMATRLSYSQLRVLEACHQLMMNLPTISKVSVPQLPAFP